MDGNSKINKEAYYGFPSAKCPNCGSSDIEDATICVEDGQGPTECPVNDCGFIKDGNHPSRCSEGREGGKCLSCGHTWRD